MANSKTQYLEAAFLNKVLKNTDFTVPGVFIGLKVGATEVAGNGYARQQITAANWSAPADDAAGGMESHNTIDIFFPQASGGAWAGRRVPARRRAHGRKQAVRGRARGLETDRRPRSVQDQCRRPGGA